MSRGKRTYALKRRPHPPGPPFEQLAVLNISGCVIAWLHSCAPKRPVSLGEDVAFASQSRARCVSFWGHWSGPASLPSQATHV